MDREPEVHRFPVDVDPAMMGGYEINANFSRKGIAGFIEEGGRGCVIWRSDGFDLLDDQDAPTRKPKESYEAFAVRVAAFDKTRQPAHVDTEITENGMMALVQEQGRRLVELKRVRKEAEQAEHIERETQAAQDEQDFQIFLSYTRGKSIARQRGINI